MAHDGGDLALHLEAARDAVDHPVLEQKLAALEALGELLADGGLDDARSGEAHEGLGLGDVHVTEEGEAGGDAAGRGMEEHADEWHVGVAEALARGHGLGHLHEAQDALLHTSAAGGLEEDDGEALRGAALEEAGDLLADHRAHRAAHEVEDERAVGDGDALDVALAGLDRLLRARVFLRGGDAIGIRLSVGEREGIGGQQVGVPLLEARVVEHERAPAGRAELVMPPALRTDLEIVLEGLRGEGLAAAVALAEDALAEAGLLAGVQPGGLFFGPRHRRVRTLFSIDLPGSRAHRPRAGP